MAEIDQALIVALGAAVEARRQPSRACPTEPTFGATASQVTMASPPRVLLALAVAGTPPAERQQVEAATTGRMLATTAGAGRLIVSHSAGRVLSSWATGRLAKEQDRRRGRMYGTVARLRIKPGSLDQIAALSREYEDLKIPGHLATYAIQMDADANELLLVAVFASKEAYLANAGSPEQHARYMRMRELLEHDPEWHDGQVIQAHTA